MCNGQRHNVWAFVHQLLVESSRSTAKSNRNIPFQAERPFNSTGEILILLRCVCFYVCMCVFVACPKRYNFNKVSMCRKKPEKKQKEKPSENYINSNFPLGKCSWRMGRIGRDFAVPGNTEQRSTTLGLWKPYLAYSSYSIPTQSFEGLQG